jgi:hypothetical protein
VSLTLSPAVKIFALLSVLATLALGAGMFVLGGAEEEVALDEAALVAEIKLAKKTAKSATARTNVSPTATKPKTKATAKPAAKAAPTKPKVVAKPTAVAKPKPEPAVAANGLPTTIVSALRSSPIVVVSLFDDAAKIDPMAHDEAQAGAKLANAGFVALDVTRDQKAAEALMLKFGAVLRAPMVLFFGRSGELELALDGFRDRDTVAQAALNALR